MTTTETAKGATVLRVRGVTKHYGHVQALRGVDMEVRAGEVVGLVGDNGAGKSTLVGVLSGATTPTDGTVEFEGEPVSLTSPSHARDLGIETVYQDLALALDLPVWANLHLGREQRRKGVLGKLGFIVDYADRKVFGALIASDHVKYGKVIRDAGIAPK